MVAGCSDVDLAKYEMLALVTQQRLNNVLSKHGRLNAEDPADCRAVLGALREDVMAELDEATRMLVTGDRGGGGGGGGGGGRRPRTELQRVLTKAAKETIQEYVVAERRLVATAASGGGGGSSGSSHRGGGSSGGGGGMAPPMQVQLRRELSDEGRKLVGRALGGVLEGEDGKRRE